MRTGEELSYFVARLSYELPYLELFGLSDFHYGNPFCSLPHIDRQIEYIRVTPQAFALLNGDLCECATKKTKRSVYSQTSRPQDQRDWAIDKLYPIRDKLLGMDDGNHEKDILHESDIDISRDIAQALGIPYDPDGLYLKIMFGDHNRGVSGRPFVYWAYATHGYGGARTKAAKAVKVERLSTWLDADIYFMSHDHVVNAAPDIYIVTDPRSRMRPYQYGKHGKKAQFEMGRVIAHRKMLIKTNAYLKWGGYARHLGFPPVDLVTPTVLLGGEEKPWPNNRGPRRLQHAAEVRVVV